MQNPADLQPPVWEERLQLSPFISDCKSWSKQIWMTNIVTDGKTKNVCCLNNLYSPMKINGKTNIFVLSSPLRRPTPFLRLASTLMNSYSCRPEPALISTQIRHRYCRNHTVETHRNLLEKALGYQCCAEVNSSLTNMI